MSEKLDTSEKIEAALTNYRPDQVPVIKQMARERGLDDDNIAIKNWWSLITEEAEWSESIPEEKEYAAALRDIANRIPV